MATKKNKDVVKLNGKDRMTALELQRELLQIKEQAIALDRRFNEVNQVMGNFIGTCCKKLKLDPNSNEFDLQALEFRRKK